MNWFEVDKNGLAKLLARKGENSGIVGQAWLLFELIQNAWDTDASEVSMALTPVAGRALCRLQVEDNSSKGFTDLTHSWTLFAESEKKGDPEKRGRFNLGEKLFLSLCESAEISSTTGTVRFSESEGRRLGRKKRDRGTLVDATLRMTRSEYESACRAIQLLIPPVHCRTLFNGEALSYSTLPIREFKATLPTEISDAEGILRKTRRATMVSLFPVRDGGVPMLYEMGIPVVELTGGEPWNISIGQKVPLNVDRDNVTPAYLRELRMHVLNEAHSLLTAGDDVSEPWVTEAITNEGISVEALEHAKVGRFGENSVTHDVRDLEANHRAVAEGYTVIPGGALPKGAWANLKKHGLVSSAGKIFPTQLESVPGKTLSESELSCGMRSLRDFAQILAKALLGCAIDVAFYVSSEANVQAQWGNRKLSFNVSMLGEKWFERGPSVAQVDLILHEFGHHFEANHLSESYYHALTKLGAELAFAVAQGEVSIPKASWGAL